MTLDQVTLKPSRFLLVCSYSKLVFLQSKISFSLVSFSVNFLGFPEIFTRSTFSLNEHISPYVYEIWVVMSFLCSKSDRDQLDQDI